MDVPLTIHVSAGAIGLIAGAAALVLGKGSAGHKQAGYIFVTAMIVMAIPGGIISYTGGKTFDALSSLLTCYMVLTGWIAFKPTTKPVLVGLMCMAGVCFAGYLSLELYALIANVRATDAPAGAGYIFATVLALALLGDYKRLRRPYPHRQAKIRHLWRMNFGLLVATVSFFGARPHLFPSWAQASGLLLLLAFAPILVMAYWRFRLMGSE